jgi:hypothetical protein
MILFTELLLICGITENIVMLVTELYQTINGYRITESMNYYITNIDTFDY